jgi:hypothetical protein
LGQSASPSRDAPRLNDEICLLLGRFTPGARLARFILTSSEAIVRIPTQVTPKQGRWLDIILYSWALLMLAPLAIGAAPFVLTLASLWPLLVLPIILFQRAFPHGEEHMEEQIDRAIESVRPKHWTSTEAHAH